MRGTGHNADRWLEQGWVVGITFTWKCFRGPKVLVWSSPGITIGKGRNSHSLKQSSGVAVSLGEGQTSEQEPWQLSEAEGQAGSADDGGRVGVVEMEAEKRLNCIAWGEIPQTEEALHMNMDVNMRQI